MERYLMDVKQKSEMVEELQEIVIEKEEEIEALKEQLVEKEKMQAEMYRMEIAMKEE